MFKLKRKNKELERENKLLRQENELLKKRLDHLEKIRNALENENEQFGKDLVLMKETLVEKQSENEKILERVRMLSSEIERI